MTTVTTTKYPLRGLTHSWYGHLINQPTNQLI